MRYNWVYEKRNRRRNERVGEVGGGKEEEKGKAQSQGWELGERVSITALRKVI